MRLIPHYLFFVQAISSTGLKSDFSEPLIFSTSKFFKYVNQNENAPLLLPLSKTYFQELTGLEMNDILRLKTNKNNGNGFFQAIMGKFNENTKSVLKMPKNVVKIHVCNCTNLIKLYCGLIHEQNSISQLQFVNLILCTCF